jgi:LysM repeat protein
VAAPAALLLAATAAILLVRDALYAGDEPRAPAGALRTTAPTSTRALPTTTRPQPARYHVVEPGDTLVVIGERYDTTIGELVRLNPDVDPTNLVVGRRIRVG